MGDKKEKSHLKKMKHIFAKKQKPESKNDVKDYPSEELVELQIPAIPEAPKKNEKLTLDSPDLSPDVLERIKKAESPDKKVVLVNCERCKAVIPIPIPKRMVLSSNLPIVPISYVHMNLQNKDQHCITVHIDHDFDIRRQRISDVVLSSD
ncbi:MAG: hypothetical protein ACFE8L_10260 [Candidatus Hodarchaeota archaeon]